MQETQLFFKLTHQEGFRKGRSFYTHDWVTFINAAVSPRFDSFTVHDVGWYSMGIREEMRVLTIPHGGTPFDQIRLSAIIVSACLNLCQKWVRRTDSSLTVSFVAEDDARAERNELFAKVRESEEE